jgi:hypothetical protein
MLDLIPNYFHSYEYLVLKFFLAVAFDRMKKDMIQTFEVEGSN